MLNRKITPKMKESLKKLGGQYGLEVAATTILLLVGIVLANNKGVIVCMFGIFGVYLINCIANLSERYYRITNDGEEYA